MKGLGEGAGMRKMEIAISKTHLWIGGC